MKNSLVSALLLCIITCAAFSQSKDFVPSGKITGQIFVNYHYDLTENVQKKSQFEILRSNFGYFYNFSQKLTGKIVFDAANDGKAFSVFLKNASLEWKATKMVTLEGGMNKTFIFDTQEDFFGYRYVMESLQDREKFYSTYDLGFKAIIKPADFIQYRIGVFNGEGYKKIQDDFGMHRVTMDLIIRPIKGLVFKTYYDISPKRDTAVLNKDLLYSQNIINFFLGYEKTGLFRIGAEYDMQRSSGNRKDNNLEGLSFYGTYIRKNIELFARYDQIASNILSNATESWNFSKDYSMMMGGISTTLSQGIRASVNYRHFIPEKPGSKTLKLVYLNIEVKF